MRALLSGVVLRKNLSRDGFQQIVMMRAAETCAGNDAIGRLVRDVRSGSLGALGRSEVQSPVRNEVVHGCNGTSTPQEPPEDAVR